MNISATYSVEDNKLRIYADERLDEEDYLKVKEAGFRWAPKQGLFVAPRWTPAREDLCIELAGDIEPEESTITERAEQKAERLENLAVKRAHQSSVFADAASEISKRFEFGQPILVGHHSERKARKDQERMNRAMDKAVKAHKAVDYWNYRASGVERHANRHHAPRVRANRIKTLMKEFRDHQRSINHCHLCVNQWVKISGIADPNKLIDSVRYHEGAHLDTGKLSPFEWDSSQARRSLDEAKEYIAKCIDYYENAAQNPTRKRITAHVLNRLGYERSELGEVSRYLGDITVVILQAFAREHGSYKPKAKLDGDLWTLSSEVPLPAHLGTEKSITGNAEFWQDLMHSAGYEVPIKKERRKSTAKSVPLINPSIEEATQLQAMWNAKSKSKHENYAGEMQFNAMTELTQKQYSARSGGSYSPCSTIELDAAGNKVWSNYKGKTSEPVCRIRVFSKSSASLYAPSSIISIADKPCKALPIKWDTEPQEANS